MKLTSTSAILALLLLAGMNPAAQTRSPAAATETPMVEYCALIRDATSYHKKRVRVRAIYAIGFEMSLLYKPECRGKAPEENKVWVLFDSSFEILSKPEPVKRFEELLKPSPMRPNGSVELLGERRAEVVFVGRFESDTTSDVYGHLGGFCCQIIVESVEEVKPVSESVP